MAFVPIPSCIQIVLKAHRGGDTRVNVFHAAANGAHPTGAELQAAADITAAWVVNAYVQGVSDNVIFEQVSARDVSQLNGNEAVHSLAGTHGNYGDDPLPGSVCALIHWQTPQGGRSGRGRTFAFDTTEGQSGPTGFLPEYVQVLGNIAGTLTATLTQGGIPQVIASRKHLAIYPVTGHVVNSLVYSQRDRLPLHRRHRRRHIV